MRELRLLLLHLIERHSPEDRVVDVVLVGEVYVLMGSQAKLRRFDSLDSRAVLLDIAGIV